MNAISRPSESPVPDPGAMSPAASPAAPAATPFVSSDERIEVELTPTDAVSANPRDPFVKSGRGVPVMSSSDLSKLEFIEAKG